MTRFKELKRIEAAIEHRSLKELNWALAYCKQRLEFATAKQHIKHWSKLKNKVKATITEIDSG